MRTASGVAARGGRLAASGQRKDERGASDRRHRWLVVVVVVVVRPPDRGLRRGLARQAVAPSCPVDGADKHDRQPHCPVRRCVGLRLVARHRLPSPPPGKHDSTAAAASAVADLRALGGTARLCAEKNVSFT